MTAQSDVPATRDELDRIRRDLADQQGRSERLATALVRSLAITTIAVLVAGLILPFFVPRSGDGRSATLWQAVGENPPGVVPDGDGGFWFIPIAATLLIIGVAISFYSGARPSWRLTLRRVLTVAYLTGCLIGFMVMAGYDEGTRPAGNPIGLVVPAVGAALAVTLSYLRVLGDAAKASGSWYE